MTAIVLNEQEITAARHLTGASASTATAGQMLKIETSPDGEEILGRVVPAGKQWSVSILIKIEETDI